MTPPFFSTGLPRNMLWKYPSPIVCTRIGFRIELTL